MIERKLRFALFGKEFQDNKLVAIRNILTFLSSSNTQVAIDRPFHHYLADTLHLDVAAHQLFDGDDFEADFAVSVGGDGTFLQAASRVQRAYPSSALIPVGSVSWPTCSPLRSRAPLAK